MTNRIGDGFRLAFGAFFFCPQARPLIDDVDDIYSAGQGGNEFNLIFWTIAPLLTVFFIWGVFLIWHQSGRGRRKR